MKGLTTFITPYRGVIRKISTPLHVSSPHQTYDIAVAMTYGAFRLLGYENYPKPMKRLDVEIIGTILALIWDTQYRFNPLIFILLAGVGGISYLSEKTIMDENIASQLHLGMHLCGYISFVLLVFDIMSFFIQ